MAKLKFNITEIPEGESHRNVALTDEDLDLSPYHFCGGDVNIKFYRTLHFIRVNFHVDSNVELTCDRSLKTYIQPIVSDYEVVFKVDVQEETEDENGAVRRFNFSSNTISIKDEVRDTILLNVPVKKLHPKFLDDEGNPKSFIDQAFGDVSNKDDPEDDIDPRWEKLKKLKNQ